MRFAFLLALLLLLALSAGCGKRSAVYREPPHHPEFVEGAKFSENPAKFKGKEVQFVARVVDIDGAAMQAEMHEGGPRLLVEGKGVSAAEPRPSRGDYVRLYGKVEEDDRAGYVAVIDSYKVMVPRWSELMRTSRSLRSEGRSCRGADSLGRGIAQFARSQGGKYLLDARERGDAHFGHRFHRHDAEDSR